MKLYGLASAFLHDDKDNNKLHIHCNPISMVDGDREHFEVVKDLAYKETVDITDIDASCKAFVRFVNTWEEVTRRQKDGMEREQDKDLPVAFLAGDAAFNKLNVNALSIAFFGKRMFETETGNRGLSDGEMDQFMKLLDDVSKKMKGLDDKDVEKLVLSDPNAISAAVLMEKIGRAPRNMTKNLVKKVANARKAYLEEHGSYPLEFLEACGKVPELLDQSFYHHGRFSNSGKPITGPEPNFDAEIAALQKPFFLGSERATERLKEIAAELGKYYGNEYTYGSKVFKIPGPKGFTKSPDLQAQHPELAFFHWEDAAGRMPFKDAFHEAFREANWHPTYRFMKLPMDGDKPLYTDPVADMMMEIHQIAKGQRAWFAIEKTHDDPVYREDHDYKATISEMAQETHAAGLKRHESHAARAMADAEEAVAAMVRR